MVEREDRASRPDEENPEWAEQDFRNARPGLEVIAELMGAHVAEELRLQRGQPVKREKDELRPRRAGSS